MLPMDIFEDGKPLLHGPTIPVRGSLHATVLPGLAEEWQRMVFSDASIFCQGGELVASHKLVLAALSPILREAMRNINSEEGVLVMATEVQAKTIRRFLKGIYIGGETEVVIPSELEHFGIEVIGQARTKVKEEVTPVLDQKTESNTDPPFMEDEWNPLDELPEVEDLNDDDSEEEYVPPKTKRAKKAKAKSVKAGKRKLVWWRGG